MAILTIFMIENFHICPSLLSDFTFSYLGQYPILGSENRILLLRQQHGNSKLWNDDVIAYCGSPTTPMPIPTPKFGYTYDNAR